MNQGTKSKKIVYLWMGIFVYTLIFTTLQILKYKSFFAFSGGDMADYNQAAINTAKGIPFYCSAGNDVFPNNHFHLVYLLIALLYKIFPHIYTLFFSLSFALAFGALGIYLVTRRIFTDYNIGLYFAYAFLLLPSLHFINFVDFRPSMFSIPLLIFVFYFYLEEKFIPFFTFSILVLSCKEDLAFIIIMFGIFSIFQKRDLKWIISPIMMGILWFWLTVKLILPFVGYKTYESLEAYIGGKNYSFLQMITTIFCHPFYTLKIMFSHKHISYLLKIFRPAIYFLAIFSPGILFLSLPTFMEILLRKEGSSSLHVGSASYICPIIAFSFLATIYTYKKIFSKIDSINCSIYTKGIFKKILMLVLIIWTFIGNFKENMIIEGNYREEGVVVDSKFLNARNIFNPVFYIMDEEDKTGWRLIRKIPPDASVASSRDLLPALSNRTKLYRIGISEFFSRNTNPDYIILRKYNVFYGPCDEETDNIKALEQARKLINIGKYDIVEETDSFLLLKRRDENENGNTFKKASRSYPDF